MKLNWFKLVQFCLDLNQLPQKCIFFSENYAKICRITKNELFMSFLP